MTSYFERTVNVIITAAAVATSATLVKREFFPRPAASRTALGPPIRVGDWDALLQHSVRSDLTAPVTILEFVDLECPGCRHYNRTVLSAVQQEFHDQVEVAYIHLPLEGHRFARSAAHAAECADIHGRFTAMLDVVFAKQDSIGLKSWLGYANDAGVTDSVKFSECLAGPPPVRIDSGVAIAGRLKITATPTIVINGWQFALPPSPEDLNRFIRSLLANESNPIESLSRR